MGGGRSCSVANCSSRTRKDNKHFYHFPNDQTIRDVWTTFTRRGADYEVKNSSYICEDHFDPSCFVFKKKQICLAKDTIPTIFYRTTPEGESEKIVLTFDRDIMHYVEEDTLLNLVFDKEKREEELIAKRDRKIEEIRKLCRFCLEDRNEESLVEISKLREYSISPTEMMPHTASASTQYHEVFSKSACEECFQQIIVFDGYRKRCRRSQDLILLGLTNIEKEIVKLGGQSFDQSFKAESTNWSDDDDDMNQSGFQSDQYGSRLVSPVKSTQSEPEFHHIIVKQEQKEEPMSEEEYHDYDFQALNEAVIDNDDDFDDDQDFTIPELPKPSQPKKEKPPKKEKKPRKKRPTTKAERLKEKMRNQEEKAKKAEQALLDKSHTGPASDISTRYEDETIDIKDVYMNERSMVQKCNIYECFFCKLVSFQFVK
jgi:THAP domain/Zinc-finger associated domain (zf-AD)